MAAWCIYLLLATVAAVMAVPRSAVRYTALGGAVVVLALAVAAAWDYACGEVAYVTLVRVPWVQVLGIEYHLVLDGIGALMLVLNGLAGVAGILFSWNVLRAPKAFFGLYLSLLAAMAGVFLSGDAFLLFAFFELAIIPKYFLIAVWGSGNRSYGAMKLVLYSFAGSALIFLGLAAVYVSAGGAGTDLVMLAAVEYPMELQLWCFPVLLVGFGVLAGLWPLHSWAPTGHAAAPTAASMLLAGVVMKLGAFGILRVAMPLFPEGLHYWQGWLGVLAVIGIVYGAGSAMAQRDLKYLVGYSSVSHMGFVLLGLAAANAAGLRGAVLQMFSHGVIAGLLFGVVGRMIYDRTHSRQISDLKRMGLGRALPFASVIFGLACLASMGLPGFSGFVAELTVLIGTWQWQPWLAVICAVGIVLAVGYSGWAWQEVFGSGDAAGVEQEGITYPEKMGAILLVGASLWVGLWPQGALGLMDQALQGPLFEWMLK